MSYPTRAEGLGKYEYAASVCSSSSLFSRRIVKVQVVQPFSSTDKTAAQKNSRFILSERSDFYTVNNLLIAVHAFPIHMLTSLSVDEI